MATRPDVDVLDAAFLAEQRAQLEASRNTTAQLVDALEAEVNGLTRSRETGGVEEGFHRVDTVAVELERARSEHGKATARLAEIDAAVARLDAGTYGRCEDCGGPIGRARLEAIPETRRCITCEAHPRRVTARSA